MKESNFFDRFSEILQFSRLNIFHSSSCDALAEETTSGSSDSVTLWARPLITKDHMIRQRVADKLKRKEPSRRRSVNFQGALNHRIKCKIR